MFKRQFLTKNGKEIHSTEIERQLVNSLPERMVIPDMTAHWESQLEATSEKRVRYGNLMQPLTEGLTALIGEVENRNFSDLPGIGKKIV